VSIVAPPLEIRQYERCQNIGFLKIRSAQLAKALLYWWMAPDTTPSDMRSSIDELIERHSS
jgi:hypothetical protein